MRMLHTRDGRPYEIRPVQPEDYSLEKFARIYAWIGQVHQYLGTNFAPEHEETMRAGWLRSIEGSASQGFMSFGAFWAGEMVGQASVGAPGKMSRLRATGSWGISVKQEFQNQGIGAALLLEIETYARSRGLHKLSAEVVDRNEPAIALYVRKMGYMVEGRKKEHFLLDSGEYVDLLVIGKILS